MAGDSWCHVTFHFVQKDIYFVHGAKGKRERGKRPVRTFLSLFLFPEPLFSSPITLGAGKWEKENRRVSGKPAEGA